MQRKQFIQSALLTATGLTLFRQASIARMFQQPAWKIQMLTNDAGVFTEKGGTILFYYTKDGIVVVDSQFPEQAQHLIDELKKQSQTFRLLINTHHHGDHSSGNIAFKDIVQHVLAHENSKKNQQDVAIKNKSEDKQLYPGQTFGHVWCESIGKERLCLYYFGAAHTNGDALIHFEKANIVHTGDLVANRRHPYVDRTAGASMKNWITVLDKTLDKFNKKTTYVFGHAEAGYNVTGTAEDVKAFRSYIEKTLVFVEGAIKSGKSKEEVLKTTVIPGAEEWKGPGIERPLTAAYEELSA